MPKGIYDRKISKWKPWNKGLKTGYNPFKGGITEDTRQKMREAKLKNHPRYWLGKKRPPRSKEWIENLKKAFSTPEAIERSRNTALKNKFHPNWRGRKCYSEEELRQRKILRNKKRAFKEKRREIRKLGNGGSHTFGDWQTLKAQYNWTCPACKRKESEIKLTEDHIIPISRGGSDNIENIQPLCGSCNSKKRTLIVKYAPGS